MDFGKLLKKHRTQAKLTQKSLADKIGVSRSAICDWERSKYTPTGAHHICALEKALGFEYGYLYTLLYVEQRAIG